jgi:putative transposase
MNLSRIGIIAEEHWRKIPEHFPNVELGTYALMPNHIHGILIIHTNTAHPQTIIHGDGPRGPVRGSIGAIIGAYKMSVTRRIKKELNVTDIWHRNYYEHIIRDEIDRERIEIYVQAIVLNWEFDENSCV